METKTFDKLYDELQYLNVDDTEEKYPEVVAEEIREAIRESGWECLDEYEEPDEEEGCEESHVADLDFLCSNGDFERITNHDVDWTTFTISFYGKWGEDGVFMVTY